MEPAIDDKISRDDDDGDEVDEGDEDNPLCHKGCYLKKKLS